MQQDEREHLPITLRHHSRFFEPSSMYVIDHGSTEDLVPSDVNRIRVPRSRTYSEAGRRDAVRDIASALLRFHDWGVYADCDELLDLSLFNPADLDTCPVIYVAGVAVVKVAQPSGSRMVGILDPSMCKPLVFREVPDWGLGFHGSSSSPQPMLTIPMAHLKHYDVHTAADIAGRRAVTYSGMDQGEKELGVARAWSGKGMSATEFHDLIASLLQAGGTAGPFQPMPSAAILSTIDGYVSAAPNVNVSPVDISEHFPAALDVPEKVHRASPFGWLRRR